ncbi:hypothetical protein AAF712_008166 [Marasmius tenuissimus]|uniref:tyrosinase n=1 Tax=Marasmius tenuissimus TaxID=585030 RepID=A0ABR2ZUF7_9AGAR
MSRDRYVVKGPQGVANRLEINDFIKNEAHFSLYVQALIKLQQKDQSEVDSFFQIGGIHGLPAAEWDPPRAPQGDARWLGYCTHEDVLFPTWHRPYMILMEQAIQEEAMKIAETYKPELKERFKKAALKLRQPYWDWAKNSVPPPEVISKDRLTIIVFNGEEGSVANPFRRYTFNPLVPSFGFPEPFDKWQTTLRHPRDETDPNTTENIDRLKSWMQCTQTDIRDKTYFMLFCVHTWPQFSNRTASNNSKDANHAPHDGPSVIRGNSVEAIHDAIHLNIGGGGHMADTNVAGFDPIFYMHHAQVDRLLSLWAFLNPDVWVTPSTSLNGTWTIPKGDPIDKNTDLTPFWNAQPEYWTSARIMDTASLGYTYPDFDRPLPGEPTGPLPTIIAENINRLYAGATFNKLLSQRAVAESQDSAAQLRVWEWTARIHVKKYEVGGSFSIPLFVGSVPENPEECTPESCGNCLTRLDNIVEGFAHLNNALLTRSGLESLESSDVMPYLKENLHWRAAKASGEAIELSRLPSLEVEVTATRLTLPPGSIFPVAEETIIYHEITEGKQGGARSGEA